MTHEIKLLFQTIKTWQLQGKRSVLVSVVTLEGSSYRRPGVRMVIREDGVSVGAVSGGCVEKEIEHQAQSVFQSGKAKIMTYDGRLRVRLLSSHPLIKKSTLQCSMNRPLWY